MAKRKLKFKNKSIGSKPKKVKLNALFYSGGTSDGCTIYRFEIPRTTLNVSNSAKIQITNFIQPMVVDSPKGKIINPVYTNTGSVVIQRPTDENKLNQIKHLVNVQKQIKQNGSEIPFRLCVDVDDILHGDHVSRFNSNGSHFFDNKRFEVFSEAVRHVDELHVCSKSMADFYKEHIGVDHVTYKPNFLPKYLFDWYDEERSRRNFEKHKSKPRILYAGAAQHFDVLNQNGGVDDFTHVLDLIEKTKNEWQWVFYGAHPTQLEADVKNGVIEFHKYTPFMDYAKKLIDLEPTVMLAPLQDNTFNRCKSNIKLTEAGALGIAGVFQNLEPYEGAPLQFDDSQHMADNIKFLLSDWDKYVSVLREQRKFSEDFFAEDNTDLMLASYFTNIGSIARRKVCQKLVDIQ
jgi:hypothetical protein